MTYITKIISNRDINRLDAPEALKEFMYHVKKSEKINSHDTLRQINQENILRHKDDDYYLLKNEFDIAESRGQKIRGIYKIQENWYGDEIIILEKVCGKGDVSYKGKINLVFATELINDYNEGFRLDREPVLSKKYKNKLPKELWKEIFRISSYRNKELIGDAASFLEQLINIESHSGSMKGCSIPSEKDIHYKNYIRNSIIYQRMDPSLRLQETISGFEEIIRVRELFRLYVKDNAVQDCLKALELKKIMGGYNGRDKE